MSDDHPSQFDPEELGSSAPDAARAARGSRRRRPAAALRPQRRPGSRRRAGVVAVAGSPAPSRSARTSTNAGIPKRLLADYEAVHQEVRDRSQDQHRRPQHLPGADQHLPAGPPAGRLHVVRRLPHAVLRAEGPRDADRRRLGRLLTPQMPPALQGRLDRRSTGTSTSCRSTTTRGPSSTGRASSRRTATPSRRRGTSSSRSPRR